MPLRVAAVFLAYVVYRLPGDDDLLAGLALGLGTILVAFAAVDRLTGERGDRTRVAESIPPLVGMALIVTGIALALR